MTIRPATQADKFYPGNPRQLAALVDGMLEKAAARIRRFPNIRVRNSLICKNGKGKRCAGRETRRIPCLFYRFVRLKIVSSPTNERQNCSSTLPAKKDLLSRQSPDVLTPSSPSRKS